MAKADFTQWSREGLEKLARELADQNELLREDNKVLLSAWREQVRRTDQAEALAASQAPQLLFLSQQPKLAMAGGASQSAGPSTSR